MRRLFLSLGLASVFACGDDTEALDDDASIPIEQDAQTMYSLDASAARALDAGTPLALDAVPPLADGGRSGRGDAGDVRCIDEQFAQLMLFDVPAPGLIREEGTGASLFETYIDASAGGLSTTQGFIYARFTERGLEKVELSDEDAFASSDWQIAFRRYVIRLNSGVSGPGEVKVARTAPMTAFEGLASVPADLQYRTEAYFTESCEFVPDTSGIGAPATALSSFWSYSACVAMTGNVFVLELPGGRHVKFQVRAYYTLENQKQCDETDSISQPSGAGNLRVRWAFLD